MPALALVVVVGSAKVETVGAVTAGIEIEGAVASPESSPPQPAIDQSRGESAPQGQAV